MLNVRRADLDGVLALLPALQRPTISALSDDDWVAVNTIIEERTVRDLIPALKAARAQGIVEYPLNKIVSVEWLRVVFEVMRTVRDARAASMRSQSASARARAGDDRRRPASSGACAAIVDRVRTGGDRALVALRAAVRRRLAAARGVRRRDARRRRARGSRRRAPGDPRRPPATSRASPPGRSRSTVDLDVAPGVSVEQRVEPLARVGCYVPGGRFPLPSSLLMTAVPARVAGVREVIVVCPRPEPAVMAAALEAGVTRLFRIGGAHAIAALAYGTDTIPRVDKIVGPGNRYVAAAKALVAGDCAIDFYAGPTEIVIVAGVGPAGVDCRRSRSRRPSTIPMRDRSSSRGAGRSPSASPAAVAAQAPAATIVERSLARARRDHRHAHRPERRWRWRTASRPSISSSIARR